ncbi:hypothetical protein HG531_002997 [Fusarium graminearum]|nr:hypothetical protein HG531_002997 [Fusarium graminearum]
MAGRCFESRETRGKRNVEKRNRREGEKLVMGFGEKFGQFSPPRRLVELTIRHGARWKGEKTTSLFNLATKRGSVGDEMLLCVSDGLIHFGWGLGADEFDVLLEA